MYLVEFDNIVLGKSSSIISGRVSFWLTRPNLFMLQDGSQELIFYKLYLCNQALNRCYVADGNPAVAVYVSLQEGFFVVEVEREEFCKETLQHGRVLNADSAVIVYVSDQEVNGLFRNRFRFDQPFTADLAARAGGGAPFHIGGGHSGNRFINVIQCRNFLLCNNNFSAHGAMTSLGQACMSAARRNGFVNDSSVSVGGNNLLRFENFMTLSALLAVSQACFRTSRRVSGDRLYHSMVTADGYGERSAGFSKIIEVSEVELQLNGRHTACTKGNSIIAVVNSRSCFTAFLEHAAKVVSPITIDQKHKLTQNGLGYFREHDFPNTEGAYGQLP